MTTTTTTVMQRLPTPVMAAWTCDEGCVASPCIDHGEVDTISANVAFAFVTCLFFFLSYFFLSDLFAYHNSSNSRQRQDANVSSSPRTQATPEPKEDKEVT